MPATQPKHNYQNNQDEKFARWRRRDHANIEAMQNLMFDAVASEYGARLIADGMDEKEAAKKAAFSDKLRSFISALQSAHGGGEVVNEPFERSHRVVASYLHLIGTDEANDATVRRRIGTLEEYQQNSGFRFYYITRGGQVVGRDAQGNDIYSATEYIDIGKPIADEAVMRARASDQWKGNKAQGIKAHPGLALAAQVQWALSKLPRITIQPKTAQDEDEDSGSAAPAKSAADYRAQRDPRVLEVIENWADGIEARKGDDELALEWLEVEIKRMRESRRRTKTARNDGETLSAMLAAESNDAASNATASTSYKNASATLTTHASSNAHLRARGGLQKCHPPSEASNSEISEIEDAEPNMLEWALLWASRGIPVFPLHEAIDGMCTCSCSDHWEKKGGRWVMKCRDGNHVCGSECESKGKHPRTDRDLLMRKGVKMATTDPDTIKLWWGKYQTANIGGRMLGKIGFDVDPKNGGNASLHDLCEKYGMDWLATWENESGSGGPHFIFDNPTGASFKNSAGKLGPGLDTRGDDGYLVMPPSLHASGARYKVISPDDFRAFPQELIDLLLAPKSKNEIAYQDHSQSQVWGEKFLEGQRNTALINYAIGRMRHAWERTEEEHYQRLSAVNQVRCVPPLDDDEVRIIAAHVANDYAFLYGVNVQKQEAA